MNAEMRRAIRTIFENTGIRISVFSADGRSLAARGGMTAPCGLSGIVQDEEAGCTFFRVLCKSDQYICALDGTGEVQKNYAYLLTDMIENAATRAVNLPKNEFLKRILLGECGPADVQKYRVKYSVPEQPCFALSVSAGGKSSDVIALLSQYAENEFDCAVAVSGRESAFVKFVEPDSEYQSSADFATFLAGSLLEELGISAHIGVGCTFRNFEDISVSFRQASSALRMSSMFNARGVVHTYREFLLVKMLEDIPEAKLSEYLSTLLEGDAKELLKDEEMLGTAEEFLQNSLNVSETSRNLFMHRNTLMYRLDKIERMTGLNLRKFSDAVTFRLITILGKLV